MTPHKWSLILFDSLMSIVTNWFGIILYIFQQLHKNTDRKIWNNLYMSRFLFLIFSFLCLLLVIFIYMGFLIVHIFFYIYDNILF